MPPSRYVSHNFTYVSSFAKVTKRINFFQDEIFRHKVKFYFFIAVYDILPEFHFLAVRSAFDCYRALRSIRQMANYRNWCKIGQPV